MDRVINRVLDLEPLTFEEALTIYRDLPTPQLLLLGDTIRYKFHPERVVTWQIDRNVNITNVCIGGCKFCGFHCKVHQTDRSYITTLDEYSQKIEEMYALGGRQLLLQGGMHPRLKIEFYEELFRELKCRYPDLRLHALGAPEVFHIARISSLTVEQTLSRLVEAGLDSLPGAGAEILDNTIRKRLSPAKCSATEWLDVMRIAHKMNLPTSATMMYGHVEEDFHIIQHLLSLRDLQEERPSGAYGFIAFIPWVFCSSGTLLEREIGAKSIDNDAYLRLIAISRILLNNIDNIQASYLTLGVPLATIALHSGANDLGSIMIEENVVRSTGVNNIIDADRMQQIIRGAGFTPRLRNQLYEME